MRLIDADELKKKLRLIQEVIENDENILKDVFNLIDNAPTVDNPYQEGHIDGMLQAEKLYARPQGEWVLDSDNLPVCKECGEVALQRVFIKVPQMIQDIRMVHSNYCPNCGADMRKEEES